MEALRSIAIWLCGLLGSGLALAVFSSPKYDENIPFGFIAGILLFICFRLWLKEPAGAANAP